MILATAWALAFLPRPMILVCAQVLASAAGQSAPARMPARDSVRLVRRAHSAQSDFEFVHRNHLPVGYDGYRSAPCDAVVGRFYYCSDDGTDGEDSIPAESPNVVRARTRLLSMLDSVGALLPGDDWIAGERVRYRLDAGDTASAVAFARSCGATAWWCAALAGLALHGERDFTRADSAFSAALSAMPEAQRCHWTDIALLLDGPLYHRYRDLDCAGRDSLARRIWWLSAPLYLIGTQDLRTEILSRVTRAAVEANAKGMQGSWGDDMREMMLRYGWDTWYSRIPPAVGSMQPDIVIGHESSPSFNFVPAASAVDSPFTIVSDLFDPKLRTARMRYAPAYLRKLHPLDPQIAIFRRGDSALVVAAFDVSTDSTLAGRELSSGLFLWSGPRYVARTVREDTTTRQVLTGIAAWRPLVIAAEVLARKDRNAARFRVGRELRQQDLANDRSDLLLYAPADSAPHRLEDVLPRALPTSRVRRGEPLGLFWEMYGLSPAGEVIGISLTIARDQEGLFRRAAEALRLARPMTPLSYTWGERPDPQSGIAARAVTVDLSRFPAGRYRVVLTIARKGRSPAVVSREIELVD